MHRNMTLGVAFLIAVPAHALAADALGLRESAERTAVRFATEQQDDGPERRRSMGRTWSGVGLIVAGSVVGLAMPVQREACVTTVFASACAKETNTGAVIAALGLITAGVGLATVWSDVPANSINVGLAPGRFHVATTLGF